MLFEINDIVFFIKCIKKPSEYFDISKYVSFCSHHTRSSSHFKLRHSLSKKHSVRHFVFSIEYLDFGILFLIIIDVDLSLSVIKLKLHRFFLNHFLLHFDPYNLCSYHFLCPCSKCYECPISYQFNSSVL